ncbi:MAG: hypothetical protein KME10_23470 [Plectolyngbya sp. WJT66-NPBG17]|jgi:hypothetical protein|nr:hypothetical protein [Plectolyngbya sp. WJT66-NPBG17]
MEHLKKPTPEIPSLDVGIDDDIELGTTIADLKLTAMQQGFDDRYSSGVSSFLQSQCEVESDRQFGETAAALRLEERRQTLITIAIKSALFSSISGLTALIVGFSPVQSAIAVFPSTIAAICVSRK